MTLIWVFILSRILAALSLESRLQRIEPTGDRCECGRIVLRPDRSADAACGMVAGVVVYSLWSVGTLVGLSQVSFMAQTRRQSKDHISLTISTS
jgi:hypothetical protein